jgi:hypothetical protein
MALILITIRCAVLSCIENECVRLRVSAGRSISADDPRLRCQIEN